MLSTIALALVGSLALPGARPDLQAASRSDSTFVRQWREDLAYLARELPRRHKNLFHTVRREQFDSALAALDRKLPGLARHQVIVELARIVALVGDGHTNVAPTRDPKIGFHTYPVKLYFFKDGLFVRSAAKAHADLVGARVVRIGRLTADEAYLAVRGLIGRDNEMNARFFAPFLLPRVLPAVRKTYPALKLFLHEDVTERLHRQLLEGELDVVLLALPYDLGGIETMDLFQDRFRLAARFGPVDRAAGRARGRLRPGPGACGGRGGGPSAIPRCCQRWRSTSPSSTAACWSSRG